MTRRTRIARTSCRPRLLVSVASVAEAGLAAQGGVDFIDLKDPRAGALGGLPLATIGEIVASLRGAACSAMISATIGDLAAAERDTILAKVEAVAQCGVDVVKVGIECGPDARPLLGLLAACPYDVVPVFIVDAGLDTDQLLWAAGQRFPAVMLDTADKRAGSLFERVPRDELATLVRRMQGAGCPVGVAGALRLDDWPHIADLGPDFAGFRSAVCADWRGGALDAVLLERLVSRACAEQSPHLA